MVSNAALRRSAGDSVSRQPRDVGASVCARLLQRARAERTDFQLLLTRYVLERLLYRLSVSHHRDRFILKGALLLSVWVGDRFRPTRDLDLLGYGDTSPETLADVFRAICAEPVPDDGVAFDSTIVSATLIREETEYGGVRIRTSAAVGNARIPVQVDIGCGDAVTPGPVHLEYPTLLDFPPPLLQAYPVETIVAEKLEALTVLGMANSRLKDYYDLLLICRTFPFDLPTLRMAVNHTFERRGTVSREGMPSGLSDQFAAMWQPRWRAFIGRERLEPLPHDLAVVVAQLRAFFDPVLNGIDHPLQWPPGGPWSA